ncbi:copper chaperone PCu(A)C [Streptomyces sp. XM4193]|uniref:copper chaperone PCu(A)C n=1 Tax=Streptomyces sp. XM4193 TaxID=2929782 RepID=UPI001FFB39F1|nr:copper chaperone PCu(A)C [Streptomyces sp. XM4193]MCK1794706.1 copper chaperone PCu(A)C [Streptomyces sp. XM4193]
MRRTALPAALALGALLLAGCGSGDSDSGSDSGSSGADSARPELTVDGAFVPEPLNDRMAGGFLTVQNKGDADDTLVGVSSDLSDDVQLHETVDNKMREVESFEVPAGGSLELSRGGDHLMFMGLKREVSEGDRVEVELEFEDSDPITVEMTVEAKTHNPHAH